MRSNHYHQQHHHQTVEPVHVGVVHLDGESGGEELPPEALGGPPHLGPGLRDPLRWSLAFTTTGRLAAGGRAGGGNVDTAKIIIIENREF